MNIYLCPTPYYVVDTTNKKILFKGSQKEAAIKLKYYLNKYRGKGYIFSFTYIKPEGINEK